MGMGCAIGGLVVGVKRHFQSKLLAGLLTIVPIVLTVWVLYFLFQSIDGLLRPLLQPRLGKYYVTGMGLLTMIFLVYLAGLATSNFVGKQLVRVGEGLVERLPIARHVYGPAKQLMQTIVQSQGPAFKRVVLVEYPVPGVHVLGFMTGQMLSETDQEPLYNVFLPTSPNPTTGFILVCRKEDLKGTNLTVEEAMKLVMSAGVVSPASIRLDE